MEEKIIDIINGIVGVPVGGIFEKWPWFTGDQQLHSNAIIFTNKRLFFMFLKPPKKLCLVGDEDYLNEAKIKGEELISKVKPEEIISKTQYFEKLPVSLLYEEIEGIKLILRENRKLKFIGDTIEIKIYKKPSVRYFIKWKKEIKKIEKILTKISSLVTINEDIRYSNK